VPVERDPGIERLSGVLGVEVRRMFLNCGATRIGREWVLPASERLERILSFRDLTHLAAEGASCTGVCTTARPSTRVPIRRVAPRVADPVARCRPGVDGIEQVAESMLAPVDKLELDLAGGLVAFEHDERAYAVLAIFCGSGGCDRAQAVGVLSREQRVAFGADPGDLKGWPVRVSESYPNADAKRLSSLP
jgi:hypothetical protein